MRRILIACVVLVVFSAMASAAPVTLTFEGLGNNESINNYYNGGFGGSGSGPGPSYGITFTSDSLALIDYDNGGSGNFANEPSSMTIAYFLNGAGDTMNVLAGFTTGFSFFYTTFSPGSVTVYDGLNGTGNVLGTLNLTDNDSNCPLGGDPNGPYNCWTAVGVSFSGTAYSVVFGGASNGIGFDNITLGSDVPTPGVPEPASMVLFGTGLLGIARKLRNRL